MEPLAKSEQVKSRADELARVIQRIQLRVKPVDRGCAKQRALASVNKVAELLGR